MHYLDWLDLVTGDLLDALRAAAEINSDISLAGLDEFLARVFAAVGGFPVVEAELDETARTALGLQLLYEAVRHSLASTPLAFPPTGFVLRDVEQGPIERVVEPIRRVSVNSASQSELEALPEIGRTIAERIIEGRTTTGPFTSMDEFITRVDGLGEQARTELEEAVRFDHPDDEWRYSMPQDDSFEAVFRRFVQLSPHVDIEDRLHNTLNGLATSSSGDTHPATAEHRIRDISNGLELEVIQADWAGILVGSDYFRTVPGLLLEAEASIDVCMFHIAFPSENHPTRELLDALVTAHERGLTVRVLLDRDRESDPYHSTVINSPAKEFLEQNGVPCRFDDESTLLHSKYVVLDESSVILGSHNWSAGSFFHFDDVSLVLGSSQFAGLMTQRFDVLWESTS